MRYDDSHHVLPLGGDRARDWTDVSRRGSNNGGRAQHHVHDLRQPSGGDLSPRVVLAHADPITAWTHAGAVARAQETVTRVVPPTQRLLR